MHDIENNLRAKGYDLIAGVDEAGRGPLAGPVVAAAVVLPVDYKNPKINDSKQLTAIEREQLFIEIKNAALCYATSSISPKKIDDMDILAASKLAMRQAVMKLEDTPDFIITDATAINVMDIPQMAVVKGDAKSISIAAASIIAKVTRDHLMMKAHEKYPEYGFNEHMGYGTELHLSAIKKHGATPIHRMSFAPLKKS